MTGDNLPNVVQYLREQHAERLDEMLRILSRRVPRLEHAPQSLKRERRILDDADLHGRARPIRSMTACNSVSS